MACCSTPAFPVSLAPPATATTLSADLCPPGLLIRGTGAGHSSSLTSLQRIQDSPTKVQGVRVPTDLKGLEIHMRLKEVEIHLDLKVQKIHTDLQVEWILTEVKEEGVGTPTRAGLGTLTELRGGRIPTDLKEEEVIPRKDKVCIN